MGTVVELSQTLRLRLRIKRCAANLKGLKKCEPERFEKQARNLLSKLSKPVTAEAEFDEPEMMVSTGPSECWRNCFMCFCDITPDDRCAIDHLTDQVSCLNCFVGD